MQLLGAWMISTPLLPGRGHGLVHHRGELADPARGPLAPVLVPHVAEDQGRLRRVPLDRLLLDGEARIAARRRNGLAEAGVQNQRLAGFRPPGNQENPAHQHDRADRAETDLAHELEPPRERHLAGPSMLNTRSIIYSRRRRNATVSPSPGGRDRATLWPDRVTHGVTYKFCRGQPSGMTGDPAPGRSRCAWHRLSGRPWFVFTFAACPPHPDLPHEGEGMILEPSPLVGEGWVGGRRSAI